MLSHDFARTDRTITAGTSYTIQSATPGGIYCDFMIEMHLTQNLSLCCGDWDDRLSQTDEDGRVFSGNSSDDPQFINTQAALDGIMSFQNHPSGF